jgi:NRPS condensation-like uncharacterized protein
MPDARIQQARQPAPIHRRLGPTENIYYLLDKLYCLNFVVYAEVSGSLRIEAIDLALQAVQHEQPLLRARIALRDGRAWFEAVPAPQAPLRAEARPLRDWRAQIAAQLHTPFADGAPLARLLCLSSSTRKCVIAMVFHHAIADGNSGMSVLLEVLRRASGEALALRFRRAQPSSQDLDLIKTKGAVIGSMQKLVYWMNQGRKALKFARQLPGYDMSARSQRRIEVIALSLPPRAGRALLAACRAHATTVHGALGAAQVLAINREFDSAQARNLALNSLADLRGVLSGKLTPDDLGLYVATLSTVHAVPAAPDFWALAVDIRNQLKRTLHSGDANLVHSIYREDALFPPNKSGARMVQAIVGMAPPASMLTNIGQVAPVELANGSRVQALAFLVSPPAQNPICVTATSYLDGMHLNLLYDAHKLGDAQAQRIAGSLLEYLNAAAAG